MRARHAVVIAAWCATSAVVTGGAAMADGGGRAKPDAVADELSALRTAAKCSDPASLFRPWCIAADFSTGTAGELPKGKQLFGLTIALAKGKEADALTNGVSFSALVVGADGKVKLVQIKPTNKDEERMTAQGVAAVTVVFKGKTTTAELPPDLVSYARSLHGEHPATKSGTEWRWTGDNPARMRKVGTSWVVVETTADGGVFATVLTDSWK